MVLVILRVGSLEGAGQGLVSFNNASTTQITNYYTGARIMNPAGVAMYYSTNLNGGYNDMLLNTNAVTNIYPVAGRFTGGTVAVPGAPAGSFILMEVRAWTGTFANYDSAYARWYCRTDTGSDPIVGRSQSFIVGPLGNGTRETLNKAEFSNFSWC